MVTTIGTQIDQERRRTFVGRHAERQRIMHWLNTTVAPTTIVSVTGLGGIGKSTFLTIALQDARKSGARAAWVDGRACFGHTEGLLGQLPPSFIDWTHSPDEGTQWILGIDNFEALHDISGWLREKLFATFPAYNLLILVCERKFSLLEWRLDLGWLDRVEEWNLSPFTIEEVTAFLTRRGILSSSLGAPTAQVPLVLAIYADLFHHRSLLDRDSVMVARQAFSATLLREVLEESWHEAINALCLVSRAHLDFLNAVLETPLSVSDYARLASLSFITESEDGIGLHDVAAGELLRDFRQRQPDEFDRMRSKILTRLTHEWQRRPAARNQGQLSHDLVSLVGRELELWRDYADLYENPRGLQLYPYGPNDRIDALTCLNDWARPAIPMSIRQQEALFEAVAERFPETIGMFRDPTGEAVAIISLLPITPATMAILSTVVPDIASHLTHHPDLGVNLSKSNDTRLVTMVGLRTQHPIFSAPILAGTVLRYTLESSSGHRTLGMVLSPTFKLLLEKLGFVPYPFPLVSHADLLCYSLDLRYEHIPRWAARMTGVAISDTGTGLKWVTRDGMRRVLTAFGDFRRFENLSEVKETGLPPHQLHGLLQLALDRFASHAVWQQSAMIIRQSYGEPRPKTRVALADQLSMSRATFHRHLARAVDEFTRFVQEEV